MCVQLFFPENQETQEAGEGEEKSESETPAIDDPKANEPDALLASEYERLARLCLDKNQ